MVLNSASRGPVVDKTLHRFQMYSPEQAPTIGLSSTLQQSTSRTRLQFGFASPLPPSDLILRSSADQLWKVENGRLPARSARTASLQLHREHHSAILNKEGTGDVAHETGHAVRCVKRHARVGGARFCPSPVGEFVENLFSFNVS